VLELPPTRTSFAQGYRDAPQRSYETPAVDAVLGGAEALCQALGDETSARALSRATLEDAFVTANDRSVRRFVLRLDAADFAAAERDVAYGDRLMRAVRSAATTPTEMTSAVFLAVRLADVRSAPDPEMLLIRALERKNAVVVPISRDEKCTRFAVIYQKSLAVVELENEGSRLLGRIIKSGTLKSSTAKIAEVRLSNQAVESVDAAEMASANILREIYEK
jgi:hypothetical protein